jgi:nucleotide-binding universal stress UspA family protein
MHLPAPSSPALRRILLAVDAAHPSPHALAWAGLLARRTGAVVDALGVQPNPPLAVRVGRGLESASMALRAFEGEDARAGHALASLAAAFPGVRFLPHLLHGDIAEAILLLDRRLRPDLVVVGAPGPRGDTVADDVKRHALADVLVARAPPEPALGIVAGTDGSASAVRAVARASKMAGLLGSPLQVVEARPGTDATPPRRDDAAPEPRVSVVRAPPLAALLDASAHATLVVVGMRGAGPLGGRMLGRVSEPLSRQAASSVLVVR